MAAPGGARAATNVRPVPASDVFVQLVSITAENVRAVCDLSVRKDQERFVTSAAISLARIHR